MGLCTFIGKHIDVFFRVLFFYRNNVSSFYPSLPVFSLNSSQNFERGFAFLDGTDQAGWKLLALPLLGGSLAVIVTNTLSCCEVRRNWSGGMWYTLSSQVSNALRSMFVAQFWTQVNTLFPPHAQQATHSSRGEGWQCGSCSSSQSSNSIRCGSSIRESVLFSKTCQCVQFLVLQKALLREILQCNRLAQKHNARNEGRDIKRLRSLPFPFPLALADMGQGYKGHQLLAM